MSPVTALTWLLPHRLLSSLARSLAYSDSPRVRRWLIDTVVQRFGVDLGEAAESDPRAYPTFNAFFTRALKPGARVPDPDPGALLMPADGRISQCGPIEQGRIFQAKGRSFTAAELLGSEAAAAPYAEGLFATVYLSPKDYHRVHMPWTGRLLETVHVPGRLFAVNPPAVRRIDEVFARNERVSCVFDTAAGPMAVVMVGALFVGSIETVWAGEVTPPTKRGVTHWTYDGDDAPRFKRGDEIGRFNMGSTVILAFGPGNFAFDEMLRHETRVQMGERIGRVQQAP